MVGTPAEKRGRQCAQMLKIQSWISCTQFGTDGPGACVECMQLIVQQLCHMQDSAASGAGACRRHGH